MSKLQGTPEGCKKRPYDRLDFWHPSGVRVIFNSVPVVVRSNDAPATFWQPSGLLLKSEQTSRQILAADSALRVTKVCLRYGVAALFGLK